MAATIAVIVLIVFFLGFRVYARYIGERVYEDREEIVTPAHEFRDDRDYVPTNKHVLFGHHFTSIAGAAPIIGPCIAVHWGWLPGLIWVVLGTVFMGAVHDFGALVVSVREKGRTIAEIAGRVVSGRARLMFMCFVLVLVWLVLAVFAMAIAGQFVATPSAVVPVNIQIIVAIVIGWLIYKRGIPPLWPSLIALAILYFFVWVGTTTPINFKEVFAISGDEARTTWVVLLFIYAAVASLLPVWLLLQPRDYINSHQLLVGLGLIYAGLFVIRPEFDAPMLRGESAGAPPIVPLLFVTIACGAISGFHALVSSGTTSKQLGRLSDARAIGYGGMLGEGSLALASVMAAAAGIALVGSCELGGVTVENLSWSVYYDNWGNSSSRTSQAFVLGGGALIETLGISNDIARTLMAVLVICFAATTLDTAARIQRFVITEIGSAIGLRALTNRYTATVVAILPAVALALLQVDDPAKPGTTTEAGRVLWPIFGASNQMLAALTLMVLALYFSARKRPVVALLVPMLFVTAVAVTSLFVKLNDFIAQSNWPLVTVAVILLAMMVWMLAEGLGAYVRRRKTS